MNDKPHPHAEILRAIANGVPLSEFEISLTGSSSNAAWYAGIERTPTWLIFPEEYNIRRKQQTHIVNGFTVPAPMDKEPSTGDSYFTMSPYVSEYYSENLWSGFQCEKLWLKRGIVHATKEAAIANAKAMLKIDPSKE